MARYYYLLIAFDHPVAAKFWGDQFARAQFSLSPDRPIRCKVDQWSSQNDRLYWVSCQPIGVSLGVGEPIWIESSTQLDQVAALLYGELSHCSSFLCAIAGWEVADLFLPDSTCGYEQLAIDPSAFHQVGWSGLVLREDLWVDAGKPTAFRPLRPAFVWIPYQSLSLSGW